jgi:hypothetical protein
MTELQELALEPLVPPQPVFPVASRSMTAAISALTGGIPVASAVSTYLGRLSLDGGPGTPLALIR